MINYITMVKLKKECSEIFDSLSKKITVAEMGVDEMGVDEMDCIPSGHKQV